ncbi:MAG: hypothetical protein ACRC7S_16890 [Cetobacterium sp.]
MGETSKDTGMGGYGLIIFLILLFFIFFWGNGRGTGAVEAAAINGGCGRVSNCDVERLTLEESCKNYLITTNTANATQAVVVADGEKTRTKIDFYEYQNLRDQLQDAKAKNMFLEGRIYSDAQFNAIKTENAELKCMIGQLPKSPPIYAQSALPCASDWPTGCGTKGLV